MTKSLTEQWRDGKLPIGKYYIKTKWWGCDGKWHYEKEEDIDYIDGDLRFYQDDAVAEVLAPVPSYEEWKELKDFKQRAIDDSTTNPLDCMQIEINGLEDYIKKLEQQLAEANDVIKKYATGTTQIKAKTYEGSCYITDPFTGEQKIIEDWGEEYDADVPMSNDDKPAKKYLKKWGVK